MINYKTGQRKIIMDYLIKNKDKFVNAEEILEYMKKNKQEVGLTTIYRFLNLLEKNNNVRVETENHTKYYQYVPQETSNHLFLKYIVYFSKRYKCFGHFFESHILMGFLHIHN